MLLGKISNKKPSISLFILQVAEGRKVGDSCFRLTSTVSLRIVSTLHDLAPYDLCPVPMEEVVCPLWSGVWSFDDAAFKAFM